LKRILLDQGLAPHAATVLREHGFDAVHVSELGMEPTEDSEILAFARSDSRVCVTLDHDFHAHLAATGRGLPSVVLLRVQGLNALGQADLIRTVYLQCEAALIEALQFRLITGPSASGDYRLGRV
jgi:predicted nuclease of predicted toxin-antitoxin system